ncbi:alpha/beta hydrolase [Gordonia sp. (in: high G+C Gram-positive bacteria)]|uniref:alpha/beta hydrolase n=1 Tax=Gordonia sp. (in: high G+C Gram-positive bacteria) TaxID=84139 RepID=UPI0039E6E467
MAEGTAHVPLPADAGRVPQSALPSYGGQTISSEEAATASRPTAQPPATDQPSDGTSRIPQLIPPQVIGAPASKRADGEHDEKQQQSAREEGKEASPPDTESSAADGRTAERPGPDKESGNHDRDGSSRGAGNRAHVETVGGAGGPGAGNAGRGRGGVDGEGEEGEEPNETPDSKDNDRRPHDRAPEVGPEPKIEKRQLTPSELDDRENRQNLDNSIVYWENEKKRVDALPPGIIKDAGMKVVTFKLDERYGVRDALTGRDGALLLKFEENGNKPVLAAVSMGNPDKSDVVSLTVPGVGTHVRRVWNKDEKRWDNSAMVNMTDEAEDLRKETLRQLNSNLKPGERKRTVATIAWIGYQTPTAPALSPSIVRTIREASTRDLAEEGAKRLDADLQKIRSRNPDASISLFGHSYGSLTASLALQRLRREHPAVVDNAVFYGSPGLGINSVDELGLAKGHVFVMRGEDDLIADRGVASLAEHHGWGKNPYKMGIPELSTQNGWTGGPDGDRRVFRERAYGHSEYGRKGANNELRMSGYNLARVLAGKPPVYGVTPYTGKQAIPDRIRERVVDLGRDVRDWYRRVRP